MGKNTSIEQDDPKTGHEPTQNDLTQDENTANVKLTFGNVLPNIHEYADTASFPETGAAGNLYIDTSTDPNTTYRWDADEETYVQVGGGAGGGVVETTWADLKDLRDSGELAPGQHYRITDYTCTTTTEDTQSAGHLFDIIVLALDGSHLSERAWAAHHAGDSYFEDSDLAAWQLWYALDNDTDHFAWADTQYGKGVIYWMEDEHGNQAPYDFKNILFRRWQITSVYNGHNQEIYPSHPLVGTWGLAIGDKEPRINVDSNTSALFYTFSSMQNGSAVDASLTIAAHDNTISSYIDGVQKLNNMVFINASGTLNCYGNRFGVNCHHNTFGNYVQYNTFGNDVGNNTFGNSVYWNTFGNYVYYNTFGNDVYNNTFGNYVHHNTFGNNCYQNSFGNDVRYNTFGNDVQYNTFGNSVYNNTFGNNVYNNTFGNYVYNNTFGNSVHNNTFGNSVYRNTFGNYVRQLTVFEGVAYCDVTGGSNSSSYVQNAQILNGTQGAGDKDMLTISFVAAANYTQCAARNSTGTLKIWCPADLVVAA